MYEYDNASGGDAGHITNAYTFDITSTTRTGSRIVALSGLGVRSVTRRGT